MSELSRLMKLNPATINADEEIQQAAALMRELHVGDLVVTTNDADRKIPVGVITDRDLVMSTLAIGVDAAGMRVGEVMSPRIVTVKSSDQLAHAVHLMKEHGIQRLPVVDSTGKLEGIISAQDLFPALLNEALDLARVASTRIEKEAAYRRKFV